MQLPRADYTSSGTDEEGTTRCGWADAAKHAAGTPATQRRPAPRLAPPNDVPRGWAHRRPYPRAEIWSAGHGGV